MKQRQKEFQKRWVLCCSHQKIVHRQSGKPASPFVISQLDDLTKTSHGLCNPCVVRLYGMKEAVAVMGETNAAVAMRFMTMTEGPMGDKK